ncbi:hypothetical protein [Pseudoalteromonas lipolytica]|uniref:Uncharacterized protein n=3 Tax=Pseudoalteromonas lipolytica TaxID=570156 RepID=A0ABY1GEF4_9GAMM|nr:hypothetical protein [Pseudoalteromonas lipolytica]MBE0353044.1 hypothetical protein [Pseudoalteromonas lipolytica LMEB 39]SFT54194.1 hypothetical protein SAMN04487854_104190 [Pseudoalteromonas lipolytica]
MNKNLEKFLRKRKKAIKNPEKYRKVYVNNIEKLDFYIKHGKTESGVPSNEKLPFFNWEVLNTELLIPCDYYEMDAQASFLDDNLLDLGKLNICLSYGYYMLTIQSYKFKRFRYRFSREPLRLVSPTSVFQLSIAVILHNNEYACQIYTLFQAGYMKHWVNRSKSHIGDFIILLFDKVKGGNTLKPIVDDFAYQALLDNWDSTDLTEVTAFLNQLCDDQVTQVASPPSKMFFEFDNMNWQFTPYAALMLLTLRAQHGLENPDFEHPGFGNLTSLLLTQPVAPQKDDVLEQLVAKLHEQGFGELPQHRESLGTVVRS